MKSYMPSSSLSSAALDDWLREWALLCDFYLLRVITALLGLGLATSALF